MWVISVFRDEAHRLAVCVSRVKQCVTIYVSRDEKRRLANYVSPMKHSVWQSVFVMKQ
jgi:hypothetical protein